jgi:chromosome segregation ATPase
MKKLFFLFVLLFISYASFSQKPSVKEIDPEIKELQDQRDTIRGTLRFKKMENSKDYNHVMKLDSEKDKIKDQIASAKKAKKTDKVNSLEEKLTQTIQDTKDLDAKLKQEDKEISQLEKDLSKAEKALKEAKEKKTKKK